MTEVVCALIVNGAKLLAAQRGVDSAHPLKWEFPGGKVDHGESAGEALAREIREELGITIRVEVPLEPVSHSYPGKVVKLFPWLCRWENGELILHEHHAVKWVSPEELFGLNLLEADRRLLMAGDNLSRIREYADTHSKIKREER